MTEIVLNIALGLTAGTLAGLAFFRLLWWSTQRAVSAKNSVAAMVGGFFARLLLMVGLFAAVLWYAPIAGVSAAAGFLVARRIALTPFRKELACD